MAGVGRIEAALRNRDDTAEPRVPLVTRFEHEGEEVPAKVAPLDHKFRLPRTASGIARRTVLHSDYTAANWVGSTDGEMWVPRE